MRCRNGFLAILVAAMLFPQVLADNHGDVSLLARSGWARFHVSLGRIEVANIPSSQTRTATSKNEIWSESLQIIADTDTPSVVYNRTGATTLSIAVIDGDRVEIEQSDGKEGGDRVSFRQSAGADIDLLVTVSGEVNRYRGRSLWHLLVSEREVCRAHLLPLLDVMRPGWNLDGTLEKALELLAAEESGRGRDIRDATRRLVRRFDSPSFEVRELSYRQIGALGTGALPCLEAMDGLDMTRERRSRVHRLQSEAGHHEDSAERIAEWLVADEEFRAAAR